MTDTKNTPLSAQLRPEVVDLVCNSVLQALTNFAAKHPDTRVQEQAVGIGMAIGVLGPDLVEHVLGGIDIGKCLREKTLQNLDSVLATALASTKRTLSPEAKRAADDEVGDTLFEHNGVQCLVRRYDKSRWWVGYIRVEPNHPWHGKHYTELAVSVHGGLTFSREHEDHVGYWVGFDCGHHNDFHPADPSFGGIWRDKAYVMQQCRDLADQYLENDALIPPRPEGVTE